MRPADDRRHVVFAMRLELDVAQHDHFVVAADFLEGAREVLVRVFVAGEPVAVSLDHAPGVSSRPSRCGFFARPAQQGAHRVFGRRLRNCVSFAGVFVIFFAMSSSRLGAGEFSLC